MAHTTEPTVAVTTATADAGAQRTMSRTGEYGRRRLSVRASLGLAVAATVLLAACSTIPPQAVTDPLGLHGEQVEVAFPAALSVQVVAGEGSGEFTVDDFTESLPLRPGLLSNTVKLTTTARLSGATGPASITITDPVLTVRLWQGAESFEQAVDGSKAEVKLETTASIVYTVGTCFASHCLYEYQSGPRTLGDLSLSGSSLSTVLDILTQEPTPNSGSVSLTVQADQDELAGRTLRFTLDAAEGELRF